MADDLPDLRHRLAEAIDDTFTSEDDFDASKAADAAFAVVEDEALDRMAEHFINETKIRSMDFRNGMSMDLEPARELAAVWVGCARGMLGDAPNYTETPVTFTVKLAGELEQYAFTLQRVGKVTPHQARQAAEERAESAETTLTVTRNRLDALIAAGFGATTDTLRELRAALDDTGKEPYAGH